MINYLRNWLLLAATLLVLAPSAFAQSEKDKARLAEIRTAYTDAMNLAKKNQAPETKNTMVFQSVQTDPNGVWKRKLEFIVKQDYIEELDIYYPVVKLIRQTNDGCLQEFLYDDEGNLMFVFERVIPDGEDTASEYRYYYDKGVPFWEIEKSVAAGTWKVLETRQGPVDESDGSAIFLARVAHDLHTAFEALTVMYD